MTPWLDSVRDARSRPERDERLLRDFREARKALDLIDAAGCEVCGDDAIFEADYTRRIERAFAEVEEQMLALADALHEMQNAEIAA